jgi:hypothetical protein
MLTVIHIFIEFNTGFCEFGNIVIDKKKIAQKYLKTKFVYDFLLVNL